LYVAVRRLTLRASQCHSLKDKRAVLRKLEARVRSRFHVAISEVGSHDEWQRVVLGYAVVSGDRVIAERTAAEIADSIESAGVAELIRDDHESIHYGGDAFGDDALAMMDPDAQRPNGTGFADESWIPESWKSEETS
jgi:uncharacterized protein YlxP (DUF503 family)